MLSNYFVDIETTDDEEEITTVSPTSVMMTGPSKKRTTKKKKKKKDPNAPKRNMSAYVIFSVHIRPSVKEENPEASFGDISRIISAKYKALDDDQRKILVERAKVDSERYKSEMANYEDAPSPNLLPSGNAGTTTTTTAKFSDKSMYFYYYSFFIIYYLLLLIYIIVSNTSIHFPVLS